MNRSIRILLQLAGLLLTGAALLAADNTIAVIAVSDIIHEGPGTRRATPANPIYYYPHTTGFSNSGATIDGVTSPPKPNVEVMLVKALTSQGYIYYKLANQPASIMLVFAWGYMAPQFGSDRKIQNQEDMSALVQGLRFDPNEDGVRADRLRAATTVPRFYLTISGMDYNALSQKKHVTLWCTQVSTEIKGNQLAQVLPALIRAATPFIGTQTDESRIVVEQLATGN